MKNTIIVKDNHSFIIYNIDNEKDGYVKINDTKNAYVSFNGIAVTDIIYDLKCYL